MTGHEINNWYLRWLSESPNPYIEPQISWEDWCTQNEIPFRDTYGVIANHAQINEIRAERCKDILKQIQTK